MQSIVHVTYLTCKKKKCKSYLRLEDLQQVTLAYGYYVRPHAFDKAVWSTAGQCELSVRPRDTTNCTESGIRTRTTDLQIEESTLKYTAPTGPTCILTITIADNFLHCYKCLRS